MVEIIVSVVASSFLAVFGLYTGAIKQIVRTMIKGTCLLLHIERKKEKQMVISQEVRMLFPEIKEVKKSRENTEKVNGVSYIGIVLIVVAIVGLVLNTAIINDEAISQKLSVFLPFNIITIKVYWTSAMFAIITSGLSICINQWKKGKDYRKAHDREKLYEAAKRELSEQELIEIITKKVEGKM